MGSHSSSEVVEAQPPEQQGTTSEWKRVRSRETEIDVDVIEVSNIALAIKHKEHIVNVEVTINARCLPAPDFNKKLNVLVALFKVEGSEAVELGRTEIISDDPNPKFLNSFIVPSSTDRQEDVEFRIYSISLAKEAGELSLEQQTLLGTAQQSLNALLDNETSELPVVLSDLNHKEKTMLRVGCTEYDGGNHKYEVLLEASNFTGKMEMYYVIMVLREGEWVPVTRSAPMEVKKKGQFSPLKVAAYKFPGEESTRLRFRFYQLAKEEDEEVGETEDITLFTLLQEERGLVEKVYNKNGFVAGSVTVLHWLKVTRNSFLTYIVNGARLHLMLGIDFTNSNFAAAPLHHPTDDRNLYIAAMREIVGMLQYFDYYNQIALYGFGAKLPPYYSCVGQCFALNGNYFHPLITGGVDEIIRLYKHNLQQVQPHGPSKLSELIKVAIQFAQSDYQSTNYYVLVLLTDGLIDDYAQTVDHIIEAAALPLSIIIVGLGDGDFSQLEKLDMDKEELRSETTGRVCARDMIDFINFKEYMHEEESPLKEVSRARKTFSEIPTQYVNYMQSKKIDPNREKKGPKAAKADFINEKIKEAKNSPIIPQTDFLRDERRRMKKDLVQLGFPDDPALERALVLPISDLNYFIELYSSQQPRPPPKQWALAETVACKQEKRFEEHLERNEERKDRRIQNELLKREMNQLGHKARVAEPAPEQPRRERPALRHPCLKCREREITMLMGGCGHLAVCEECVSLVCFLCKELNPEFISVASLSL